MVTLTDIYVCLESVHVHKNFTMCQKHNFFGVQYDTKIIQPLIKQSVEVKSK